MNARAFSARSFSNVREWCRDQPRSNSVGEKPSWPFVSSRPSPPRFTVRSASNGLKPAQPVILIVPAPLAATGAVNVLPNGTSMPGNMLFVPKRVMCVDESPLAA